MLERAFLTIDNVAAVVRVEVTGVAQDLEESADAFLCLLLSLFLHVNGLVSAIKMSKNAVDELKKLKWCLIIELHHAQVLHERWAVQPVNDQLDLLCVEVGRFG